MTCSARKTEVLHLAHFGAAGTANRGMPSELVDQAKLDVLAMLGGTAS